MRDAGGSLKITLSSHNSYDIYEPLKLLYLSSKLRQR